MSSCDYAQVMLCNATYPIGCPAYRQEVGDEEKLGTKNKEEIEMRRVSGRDEQQKCTTLAKRIENRSIIKSNGTSNFRDARTNKKKRKNTPNKDKQKLAKYIGEATRNNWPASDRPINDGMR